MSRPPRAVLFDWDNTLVDCWAVIHRALAETFTAMGHVPWSLAETRANVRRSLRDSFPELFGGRWVVAREIFYASYRANHLEGIAEMPGAATLLAELSARKTVLGVVSNKDGTYLRAEAAHLGWHGFFHRLVGATDASADKPAMEPVTMALAGSGVDPGGEVWFVGDAAIDMDCARRSGCRAVLVGEGIDGEAIERFPPDLRVGTCSELADLVRRW